MPDSRGGSSRRPPADRDDAALYWVARRRLGTVSPQEERVFQAWLAEPANAAAYAATDAPVEASGELAGHPEIMRLRQAALAAAPPRGRMQPWAPITAAGLLAAGLATLAVLVAPKGPGQVAVPSTSQVPAIATSAGPLVYSTTLGEQRNVTLEDGSTVELDNASRVEVAYRPDRRDLRLLAGQAMFRVAKNKARPFVVTAGDRSITATGTAFEVRLDGPKVRVVLVEGHVVVAPVKHGLLAALQPADERGLSPGEQLTAGDDQPVTVMAADLDRATSWQRGQLIFRDETLSSAVAEFNRYTPDQLVIGDPAIGNLRISGVFRSIGSENFVSAITAYFPVDAERRGPQTIALVQRTGDHPPNR